MAYTNITPARAEIIKGFPTKQRGFINAFLMQYSYYATEYEHHKPREDYEGTLRRHEVYEGLNSMKYVLNQLGITDKQLATL